MGKSLLIDDAANGGFPEPLEGEPIRVVAARHSGCKQKTRVRVPGSVPAQAVRRVRCIGCDRDVEADSVEELSGPPGAPPGRRSGLAMPSRPALPSPAKLADFDPSSRA